MASVFIAKQSTKNVFQLLEGFFDSFSSLSMNYRKLLNSY